MRNRAKCKLCKNILESFHRHDYVSCGCGEISISGGNEVLECSAKDWKNFMRVDDKDNEIIVTVKEKDNVNPLDISTKPTREDLIGMLREMIRSIEGLPQVAMSQPITHYDYLTLLLLLTSLFDFDKKDIQS